METSGGKQVQSERREKMEAEKESAFFQFFTKSLLSAPNQFVFHTNFAVCTKSVCLFTLSNILAKFGALLEKVVLLC